MPILYILDDSKQGRIVVSRSDDTEEVRDGMKLGQTNLAALTSRSGEIRALTVYIPSTMLLSD